MNFYVCFGAKDNQSGRFVVELDGLIDAVKLVHLHGQVSCDVPNGRWSSWGCAGTKFRVFLTNSTDDILVPKVEWGSDRYKIEGYQSRYSGDHMGRLHKSHSFHLSKELRLWHSSDLWAVVSPTIMVHPALISLRCICKHNKTSSAEKLPFPALNSMLSFNHFVNTNSRIFLQ